MINFEAKLTENIFDADVPKKATRDGFGTGVVEAAERDPRVVVLCADLSESTRADAFREKFPERFVEMGVAEQNMAAVAAGMALAGKVPFITSYAAFSPGRNYEHIRTTIAINRANVKIMGMHAGVSVGPDGATHQMLEDVGLMRMLPGMTVIDPADATEAHKAVLWAAAYEGPVYIRFRREATPAFTTARTPCEPGKAALLFDNLGTATGSAVGIIASGPQVFEALRAAHTLEASGIRALVLNLSTIKPLDEEAVLSVAKRTGRVLTLEEHQVAGGMGSAVAEFLAAQHPVPVVRLGIHDRFGQSGTPEELAREYGIDAAHVVEKVREMLAGSV